MPDDDASGAVSDATREAEERDAQAPHEPDPSAGAAEPDGGDEVDPEVREHFEEMNRIGADEPGEGRVP